MNRTPLKVDEYSGVNPEAISLVCPVCGVLGNFEPLGGELLSEPAMAVVGHRLCPSQHCKTYVFIAHRGSEVVATWPEQRMPFDPSSIPKSITDPFDEAITCCAHDCFRASAVMVRRTVEVLCDENGATGKDLREQIESLKSKVMLPPEIFDAFHDLRILGNDAVHVKLKHFDNIGNEEASVAVELTREILKALYRFKGLAAKLSALKKPKPQVVLFAKKLRQRTERARHRRGSVLQKAGIGSAE